MGFGDALGIIGLGGQWLGEQQQKDAQNRARHSLEGAVGRYDARQTGFNNQLTHQLDRLSNERRAQLSALMQQEAGPGRTQAGADASALAGTQMNAALAQNRAALPWQGTQWANGDSNAVSQLQGAQQGITNTGIGRALAYGQASRGAQGLETFDRQALNNYGNSLVGIDRRAGEAQAETALKQAKLNQIWGQLGLRYGAGINNAQYAGDNTKMLGQALMLGGTYVNSTQANQPSQQSSREYDQSDPYFSAYQGNH